MINNKKSLIYSLFIVSLLELPLWAQTDEDIEEFLDSGKAYLKKGMLNEAALEFENVLIIDKMNFDAKVWLAEIYINKKDIVNARRLLMEASLQDPKHPKIKQLQKLIGESGANVKQKLVDPVIAETVVGIASATKYRKYGLVIPEDKVIEENLEKKLLVSGDKAFNEEKEIIDKIENSHAESFQNMNTYFKKSDDPLDIVFDIYINQGINQALDRYFEILAKDPTLAAKDDRGIIDEGNKIYSEKFAENPNDLETRYYYGVILFINGFYEESEEVLKPLRNRPGKYAAVLRYYLDGLNKWREQEKMRLAAIKYEEEQRLLKEAEEKAKAEAEKNDIWAKVRQKGEAGKTSGKNEDLAVATKAEASKLHNEAYKLYKKGKLDEAIEKFNEALVMDGENPEYNYHLGLAWMDKGLAGDIQAYDNAITSYQKVIDLAPDSKLAKDAASMINDIQNTKNSLGEK